MEQQTDNKESYYNNILKKIKHKPVILEYIFSFVKNNPYKFFKIIKKDKILKESLNSWFSKTKRKNNLSKELNENINFILSYKKNETIINNIPFNRNLFEEQFIEQHKDPSALLYIINWYKQILSEEPSIKFSLESIKNIIFDGEFTNNKHLVYLPLDKNKYEDALFIHKNLIDGTDIKELNVLYCIIDDNKYYNKNLPIIDKDIKINELYFSFKEGTETNDMYEVIKKYYSFLKNNNIEQITFDSNLIQSKEIINMINNALINNKTFNFPKSINIKLINPYLFENDILKLYFGLFILFSKKIKIDDMVIFDPKLYKNNTYEEFEINKGNILLIKCGISELNNDYIKNACKRFSYIIYYINNDGDNGIIDLEKKKNILLYSDIPINHISINLPFYCEITDKNDKVILISNDYNYYNNDVYFLTNYLFLLKKYTDICFSFYKNKNIYYKLFVIKRYHYYEIYYYIDNVNKTRFNTSDIFVEFCKISSIIMKIEQMKYPFKWNKFQKSKFE